MESEWLSLPEVRHGLLREVLALEAAGCSEHFSVLSFWFFWVFFADGIGDILSHLRKQVEILFNSRYGKMVINTCSSCQVLALSLAISKTSSWVKVQSNLFICCLLGSQMHLKPPPALLLQPFPLVSLKLFHWLQPRNCCHDIQPSTCRGKAQSGSPITCLKCQRVFSTHGDHCMAQEGWSTLVVEAGTQHALLTSI